MELPPLGDLPVCTVRIEAGQPLDVALDGGGVVCLGPGVHRGPLVIARSVILRGEAGAVLDGGGGGSVVQIQADELVVRIEALTVRGGAAEVGGGLALTGYSEVFTQGCRFEGNRARPGGGGGGGVFANRGRLHLVDTSFSGNHAPLGTDLLVTGVAEVTVSGGHLHGTVAAREGAVVHLERTEVDGEVHVRGTTTRRPTLRVTGGRLGAGVKNDPGLPAIVEILP